MSNDSSSKDTQTVKDTGKKRIIEIPEPDPKLRGRLTEAVRKTSVKKDVKKS